MKNIAIGVMGAGVIGRKHLRKPAARSDCDLVGSAGVNVGQVAAEHAATRGLSDYQTWHAAARRRQPGGGPVLINLIHEIDFLRFTVGEILAVEAIASNRQRGFAVEDTAAALIEFAGGALGTFLISDSAVSPWTMEQGLGESPEFPFSGES